MEADAIGVVSRDIEVPGTKGMSGWRIKSRGKPSEGAGNRGFRAAISANQGTIEKETEKRKGKRRGQRGRTWSGSPGISACLQP